MIRKVIEIEVYFRGVVECVPSWVYWVMLVALTIGCAAVILTQTTLRTQKIARLLLVEWIVLVFCSVVLFSPPRK